MSSSSELLEEPEVSSMGLHDGFVAPAVPTPPVLANNLHATLGQVLGVVPRLGQLWWLLLYGLQDRTDEHQVRGRGGRGVAFMIRGFRLDSERSPPFTVGLQFHHRVPNGQIRQSGRGS